MPLPQSEYPNIAHWPRPDQQLGHHAPPPTIPQIPIPDMRFEQSYLVSINRYIKSKPMKSKASSSPSSFMPLNVDWNGLIWQTFKDQIASPMFSGFYWHLGTVILASTGLLAKQALFPSTNPPRSKSTVKEAVAKEEFSPGKYWSRFVNWVQGGVEAGAVLS